MSSSSHTRTHTRTRARTGQRTLRSRVEIRREADVLIDSQAPVLDAVLQWCHRASARAQKETVAAAAEEEKVGRWPSEKEEEWPAPWIAGTPHGHPPRTLRRGSRLPGP